MTTAIIILAICTVPVLAAVFCAPWGWQDETGFHYGRGDDE